MADINILAQAAYIQSDLLNDARDRRAEGCGGMWVQEKPKRFIPGAFYAQEEGRQVRHPTPHDKTRHEHGL